MTFRLCYCINCALLVCRILVQKNQLKQTYMEAVYQGEAYHKTTPMLKEPRLLKRSLCNLDCDNR